MVGNLKRMKLRTSAQFLDLFTKIYKKPQKQRSYLYFNIKKAER